MGARWTSSGSFSYVVDSSADTATVARFLADLPGQRELHPLIERVERIGTDAAAARYAITDRLAWGPLRFRITYTAEVLRATDDEVLTVAHQRPATTVRNHTRVLATPTGSRAEVVLTMRAPRWLFRYAFAQAQTAHAALAVRAARVLDGLAVD
jgi:hypothetical protein